MASAPARRRVLSWQFASALFQGLFYLAYPLVIYAAHTQVGTRGVGGILLGLYAVSLVLRMRGSAAELWQVVRQHAALAGLIASAMLLDDRTLLLLIPMLVSLYLFATFAWSLRRGPPMIERFARIVEDDLPDFTLSYCRKATKLWCVFLAGNSALVLALAVAAPIGWWALYTGALFYVLLGVLLAGEFVFRKAWFRYYGDGPVERLLARWLPPERTANGRRSLAYVAQRRPVDRRRSMRS